MSCNLFRSSVVSFAALALTAAASCGEAATINTYSFSQPGYVFFVRGPTGPGTLNGTFSGTLNSLGEWQLGDLSSLSLTISYPTDHGTSIDNAGNLAGLSFFSFNTSSGSDLSLVFQGSSVVTCVGATATLLLECNPTGSNPADTFGDALINEAVFARTNQAPVITLLSSVTSEAAVPEPATWAMMLLGFGVIGCATRKRRAHWRPGRRLISSQPQPH